MVIDIYYHKPPLPALSLWERVCKYKISYSKFVLLCYYSRMFQFFSKNAHYITSNQARSAGTGLLFNSLICILFSLAIFSRPELLAFFVATLLMIIGVSMLTTWWKMQRWK
jgi:hypothetical protein